MKSIWKKHKEYVIVLSFGLLFFVMIRYFIIPLYQKIQSQRNAIEELLIDNEMRSESIANIDVLREQTELIRSKKDAIAVKVDKDDIVQFIEVVEQLADETHNTVVIETKNTDVSARKNIPKQQTDVTEANKTNGTKEKTLQESIPDSNYISINIVVTGEYNDILHFLKKFETMSYATDILSFSMAPKMEDAPTSQAHIPVNIFSASPSGDSSVTRNQDNNMATPAKIQAIFDTVVYVTGN